MRLNTRILAILTLFTIVMSATAVSAIDSGCDVIAADETTNGNTTQTNGVTTGNGDDSKTDGNSYQYSEKTPDEKGIDEDAENSYLDVGDNPYHHGAKTPNEKAFDEEAEYLNALNAAAGDDDAVQSSNTQVGSSATGNPLVALLATMGLIGTTLMRSRK